MKRMTSEAPRRHIAQDGPSVTDGKKAVQSITIQRPVAEVYAVWRNLRDLPNYMKHLESVTIKDDRISHWVMRPVGGIREEWDAEIISDEPNQMISWRSLPDSKLPNAGSVWFSPGPNGDSTTLRLEISYQVPGGKMGAAVAKGVGVDAEALLQENLTRLKEALEGPKPSRPPNEGSE